MSDFVPLVNDRGYSFVISVVSKHGHKKLKQLHRSSFKGAV